MSVLVNCVIGVIKVSKYIYNIYKIIKYVIYTVLMPMGENITCYFFILNNEFVRKMHIAIRKGGGKNF